MRLIAKVIRISHAKFHCNRLTTVQDDQDYASLIFGIQGTFGRCYIKSVYVQVRTIRRSQVLQWLWLLCLP